MKIMMVAGEPSGDAHGAALIEELKKIYPDLTVYGIGGPRMLKQGLHALHTIEALSVHGLIELIPHLPRLYRILWELRDSLESEKPDMAIFVDYPGFNLKLAAYTKKANIPVVWFSSPQVWAWRKGRVHKIAKVVDKILVLFPFEEKIYQDVGMDVSFVGHPRAGENQTPEQIQRFKEEHHLDSKVPLITLAMGSRVSEVQRHLPTVLETLEQLQQQGFEAKYLLPVSETLDEVPIKSMLQNCSVPVQFLKNSFLESIYSADAAIVCSGTATLQTGLAATPFVIIYRVSPLTFKIAKLIALLPYIGLVNIIAGRFVVRELLQDDFTPQNLSQELLKLLQDTEYREQMIKDLKQTRVQLGEPGAYRHSAKQIEAFISDRLCTGSA